MEANPTGAACHDRAVTVDSSRRLQALYVPVGDGVRLAVEVWLPVERVAAGPVGTVVRVTRYHRAEGPAEPAPEDDGNRAAGELWTGAGFALVLVDARGTGASFGTRSGELTAREIADYGDVIDWVAAQPWSDGRVGVYGTSYEGQAAELIAALGNPHVAAVAALFSPFDPYRELFYPGGCGTDARFARWMVESQLKDGVAGALDRLVELAGLPPERLALPGPVKPVDGPDGPALLAAAVAEHQGNADVHELMARVPCRDDRLAGLDWTATAPASAAAAIEASGVPLLVRAGWLDGAFAAGALTRFATLANHQQVEIGPWGHGGTSFADTLRPTGTLSGELLDPDGQDRRLVEFFARYVRRGEVPEGPSTLSYGTLGTDGWATVTEWPPPELRGRRWYLGGGGGLDATAGPGEVVRHVVDAEATSGSANRWVAIDQGRGAAYPDRAAADAGLLTFTGPPLDDDLHVLGFPVVVLRLATTGTDGAVYAYLEAVAPDGRVVYLTEGGLRLMHHATAASSEPAGPAAGTGLGVPRTFGRAAVRAVVPGEAVELAVSLLPVSALVRAGWRLRVAVAGHDASCFARYGAPGEAFDVTLGGASYLELPVRSAAG
jgi:putative CocE/NonD family hydrolase